MWKVEYMEQKKKSRKKSRKRALITYFLYCFYFFCPCEYTSFSKGSIKYSVKKEQFNMIARIQKIIRVLRNWLWPFGKISQY